MKPSLVRIARVGAAVRSAVGTLLLAVALVTGAAAVAMLLPAGEPMRVAQHAAPAPQVR
jgi:hypothetical protein